MSLFKRTLIATGAAAAWLAVLGFVVFATSALRQPAPTDERADGIVVLTGGATRIAEGARLLAEGRARRMLISGVNRIASREEVMKLSGISADTFDCCVDLGYSALDTYGNAEETRQWASNRKYQSLIVVTASYHMPRSLTELSREMPGTRLLPHPVLPKHFRREAWWLHYTTARTLAGEYLKFLPSAARYGVARLLSSLEAHSIATRPIHRAGT